MGTDTGQVPLFWQQPAPPRRRRTSLLSLLARSERAATAKLLVGAAKAKHSASSSEDLPQPLGPVGGDGGQGAVGLLQPQLWVLVSGGEAHRRSGRRRTHDGVEPAVELELLPVAADRLEGLEPHRCNVRRHRTGAPGGSGGGRERRWEWTVGEEGRCWAGNGSMRDHGVPLSTGQGP